MRDFCFQVKSRNVQQDKLGGEHCLLQYSLSLCNFQNLKANDSLNKKAKEHLCSCCQAQPKPQPANPQLWGTYTIHPTPTPTPYTRNSSFACLEPFYRNYWDLFMTC